MAINPNFFVQSENSSHKSPHKSSRVLTENNKTIDQRENSSTFSFWFIFLDLLFLIRLILFWSNHEWFIQWSSHLLTFGISIPLDCFLFFSRGLLFCLFQFLSPCSQFLNLMLIFCWYDLIFCSEKELLLSFRISDEVNALVWRQPSFDNLNPNNFFIHSSPVVVCKLKNRNELNFVKPFKHSKGTDWPHDAGNILVQLLFVFLGILPATNKSFEILCFVNSNQYGASLSIEEGANTLCQSLLFVFVPREFVVLVL